MSTEEVDAAAQRAWYRHPDLEMTIRAVADALTAGEGTDMIHQAALQEFLWLRLPRHYPQRQWLALAESTAAFLEELGEDRLAAIALSEQTATVLAAWAKGSAAGIEAFHRAQHSSGVDAPDTAVLQWGSIMGREEATALDAVERALGRAISSGKLIPGAPRWRLAALAITEAVLTRPLDIPPGQTFAGLITTERVSSWIESSTHPLLSDWRSGVANRLLNPIEPPVDPAAAIGPIGWLLALAAGPGGAALTQSNYLARDAVVDAVERFGWWDRDQLPRSEAEVHELRTVRGAAARLRLVRRRAHRLHTTARGSKLLAEPAELWGVVACESEDGEEFTKMVTELVGLRLVLGQLEQEEIVDDIGSILSSQGWSTDSGPLTTGIVHSAIWRPLRWWSLFSATNELESTWEWESSRRLTPHAVSLRPDGERMVLAYLRSRAAGPRHRPYL
ncbi:MAG: hypothetical protein M1115_09155 [Actinobacteria bacterium]|nr:hypothetical protein [Actinomycetota bacterium]